jgi:Na+/H+-dicarboxylate symporter
VILGLTFGVLTGLFVGERAGVLSFGGDAYIRLLQMTVLPYVVVSLLLAERGINGAEVIATVDVMAPTAYSFPSLGTLLGLGFVPFAAWYVGNPLAPERFYETN